MQGGTDEVTDTVEVVVTGDDPTDPTDPVASTVTATATPSEVTVGDTTKVSVDVKADGATPTGEVTLTGGGKSYGPTAARGRHRDLHGRSVHRARHGGVHRGLRRQRRGRRR